MADDLSGQIRASHPTWVRGLKLYRYAKTIDSSRSHPTWVRGLKLLQRHNYRQSVKSHPTWVRGLKHHVGS